ncbi:HNH endonuclease [Escherichia coli]|uniref:HNH endonuclease n=1 Tax=Escherichia coli TaxID=562 RepID=UPI0018479117|nr:HNH endonuclease [Escherichia coli]EFE3317949.1 HNH endonuclease [Escherichia coli]EFH6484078.1 HNH endonuclease [Escherichia coli]EFH6583419.1 HNH endonuclease [Escherichia coli]EGM5998637.1 HNH endonuclease [Escherichia coli]MBY8584533.1 HNH endonuclease [Escherichia coli]
MNNEIKFQHIKRLWYLKDGVIFSRWGNKPVAFSSKDKGGRRMQAINIKGRQHAVYIYEAIYMLHHDRAIAEDKEIHHVDGDHENNAIDNLIELTPTQHKRIHKYQIDDPVRGIYLNQGLWAFQWMDDNGHRRCRRFHSINEAMTFRDEIERPRRQQLRALGLNCKRVGNRQTASTLRQRNRQQNPRLWRHRQ